MDLTGEPEDGSQKPGGAYADLFTRLYGVIAPQAALSARLAALPRAEALAAAENEDVPAGPINAVAEAFADPQALHRGMVAEIGGSRAPRSPMRFSEAVLAAVRLPP